SPDHLVDGELLDVWLTVHLGSRRRHSFHDSWCEGVEVSARLPEVDDPPTTVDRPRSVKEQPLRPIPIRVDLVVHFVELLAGDSGELDANADSHREPTFIEAKTPHDESPTSRCELKP